jgi:G:T-mismatch repair DNA endonuclease (very short patch repair protein)
MIRRLDGRTSWPDFVLDDNIVIEANGCFWHGCDVCGADANKNRARAKRVRDAMRAYDFRLRGYNVITIRECSNWQQDIMDACDVAQQIERAYGLPSNSDGWWMR